MRSKQRFFAVAGVLAVAAGMFLSAPRASAANADADVFNFSAPSGTITPPVEPASQCHSAGFSGCGSGSYTFDSATSPGACTENSTDGPDSNSTLPDVDGPTCHITSTDGTYTNGVCGTGEAKGTATVTEAADVSGGASPSDTYTITYDIKFVAGRGVLTGTATEVGDASEGSQPVAGTVQITPLVGNCGTTGVSQFLVVGTASSDI